MIQTLLEILNLKKGIILCKTNKTIATIVQISTQRPHYQTTLKMKEILHPT